MADVQLIEAVVGNGNIETHYTAIHNNGTSLMAPTINYLNDRLEIRDKRIRELEAKNVDLERMMTALSKTVGDLNVLPSPATADLVIYLLNHAWLFPE